MSLSSQKNLSFMLSHLLDTKVLSQIWIAAAEKKMHVHNVSVKVTTTEQWLYRLEVKLYSSIDQNCAIKYISY